MRFQALFRHTINAVFIVDDSGSCIDANPAACAMLGVPREHATSIVLSDHIDAPRLTPSLPWVPDCSVNLVRESVGLRRADPSSPSLVVECSTVRQIMPGLHLVILQDITERHRAAELAQQSLRRYELLVDGIQDGVWDWDLVTGQCFYSAHWFVMRGLWLHLETPDQQMLYRAIHPDDLALVKTAMAAHLAGKSATLDVAYRVLVPESGVRWMQDRGRVSRDAHGVATRFIGISSDITGRKAAEAELVQREVDLRDSQRLGRIGNWSIDMETGRLSWSEELVRLFGMTAGSDEPGWRTLQDHLEPQSWALLQSAQADLMRDGRSYRVELALLAQQGQRRWIEARGEVSCNADPRRMRLQGTMLDITDRRRAIEAARDQLVAEQASHAKSAFLSRISHELRTPLNAILGFSELLRLDGKTPLTEVQSHHVGHIIDAGKHLLHLINDLLDLSSIEVGGLRLLMEEVDPADIIRDVIDTMTPEAQGRGMALSWSPGATDAKLKADKVRLRQVLLNLLSNAMKYNRPGGQVHVTVRQGEDGLQISVRDNGWGMTAAQQASLFQAFGRAGREFSKVPGVGLGLAICQQLVGLMGGRISVMSDAGAGSEFIITLPLAEG